VFQRSSRAANIPRSTLVTQGHGENKAQVTYFTGEKKKIVSQEQEDQEEL
jgi:hypothetical protein